MSRKGRAVAFAAVAAGLAVIALAGVALWPRAVEEWHLRKLRSGSEEEKEHAAQRLGEAGSLRAIAPLFDAIRSREDRPTVWRTDQAERYWWRGDPNDPSRSCGKFLMALLEIRKKSGSACVPALIDALDDGEWYMRYLAAFLLGDIGGDARPAVPFLARLVDDPSPRVRAQIVESLKKIRLEGPAE